MTGGLDPSPGVPATSGRFRAPANARIRRKRPHSARRSRRRAALGALGALAVLTLACALIRGRGLDPGFGPDLLWQDAMLHIRSAPATAVARWLNAVGGGSTNIAVSVVLIVVVAVGRGLGAGLVAAVLALLDSYAIMWLKLLALRPRPTGHLVSVTATAFPSGHSAYAAFLAVTLALLVARRWFWIPAAGWMALMSVSRTYLNVHWLTDVLAGTALGAALAVLAWSAVPAPPPKARRAAAVPAR